MNGARHVKPRFKKTCIMTTGLSWMDYVRRTYGKKYADGSPAVRACLLDLTMDLIGFLDDKSLRSVMD